MKKLFIIAKNQFKKTTMNKGFIIITILGPFLIIGLLLFQSLGFTDNGTTRKERKIVVTNIYDEFIQIMQIEQEELGVTFLSANEDESSLVNQVIDNKIDGFLDFPDIKTKEDLLKSFTYSYHSTDDTMTFESVLEDYIGKLVIRERLNQLNISEDEINTLNNRPEFEIKLISDKGKEKTQNISVLIFTLVGFIILIYMSIIFYGQSIGRSVLEEKSSKTVEIILSSARPLDIMAGKVIGIGLAGLLQYVVWVGIGYLAINVVIPALNIFDLGTISIDMSTFFMMVLFFLLAYFFYSGAYAALGAAASDIQNFGNLIFPLQIPLLLIMFLINTIIQATDSALIVFLSYFPFTAPLVMFARTIISNPSIYEILICTGIMIVSIIGMIILSTKIFRVGILMSGKKVNLGEIFKWLSYK